MSYNLDIPLRFLAALRKNNNRKWFEKNKSKYLKAKESFDDFLEFIHPKMVALDSSLAALDPKKLAFRIYRDVRFSKDKSPYKVNMGAAFSLHGKMAPEPGYYLHLEPGNCFMAAGLYKPEVVLLSKVRQEIDYNGKALKAVMKKATFKKYFGALQVIDKLKNSPKGYPSDHPDIELLCHKSYIVSHPFTNTDVKAKTFPRKFLAACRAAKPFNDFLKMAIE